MLSDKEVFSFPLTILDGPDGEQNFEMARANIWQSPCCKSSYNFDRLVSELTPHDHPELTLEMIHMVSYVKKVAPPEALSMFPSPFHSAESWIRDRWRFRKEDSVNVTFGLQSTTSPKRGLKSVEPTTISSSRVPNNEEVKDEKSIKVEQDSFIKKDMEPVTIKVNRTLPGFQTILQCGKTFDDDTIFDKSDCLTFNSPLDTTGRIKRIFDKSQSNFGNTELGLKNDAQLNKDPTEVSYICPPLSPISTLNSHDGTLHYSRDSPPYVVSSYKNRTHGSFGKENSVPKITKAHYCQDIASNQKNMNSEKKNVDQSKSNILNIFYDPLGLETTNWHDGQPRMNNKEKLTSITQSCHSHDYKPTSVKSTEAALTDVGEKVNVCMDDTFLLEFVERNLTNVESNYNFGFAEPIGMNSPTAFVQDMLEKVQKTINHHQHKQ
ncbi:unnamed protein product [Heterobilharzia americana]|nr:unnamed protein product [Heterobilharzia americana]CAH8499681.1 unnamed protein product [Heterobilharzia americana]